MSLLVRSTRSHSIAHHQCTASATTTTTNSNRSPSPTEHQQAKKPLVRSSSLSHFYGRRTPTRLKSLPQEPSSLTAPSPNNKHQPVIIIPPRRQDSLCHNNTSAKSLYQHDEVANSLLEWKHKSMFRVDMSNLFSSSVELWKMDGAIFGSLEELIGNKTEESNSYCRVQSVADSLWHEDEKSVPRKEMAAYLGKLDPFCRKVLKCYMEHFDFAGLPIVEAFRTLCCKIYFKAEAQEIDRILESFSYRYWTQNPDMLMCRSVDVVYTIAYSIMLLNTDLHLFQISNHTKMSCKMFCENTMATVMEQRTDLYDQDDIAVWKDGLQECLRDIYISVKSNGILQPVPKSEEDLKPSLLKRMGSITQRKKKIAVPPS